MQYVREMGGAPIVLVSLVNTIVIVIMIIVIIMAGAPSNSAPRSHFLARIVKPSGCHCTDGHLTSRVFAEDQNNRRVPTPLRSTSPFSEYAQSRAYELRSRAEPGIIR